MLVDTYPAFARFWSLVRQRPMGVEIRTWAADYMAPWPELLAKQIDCYEEDGLNWRQVARERIFPYLEDWAAAMAVAHDNLLASIEPVSAKTQDRLGFNQELNFVIYVGIGCGAGWATRYEGKPAVLFGLENIADCGYMDPTALSGLIAHEIGHLYHFQRRADHGLADGSGPMWQLYSEGFAQRCEHLALDNEVWHMQMNHPSDKWLEWCRDNLAWLAAQYLGAAAREGKSDAGPVNAVEGEIDIRAFFGSWFDVKGYKQTGYFLGHEVIRSLEPNQSLDEIALLENYGEVTQRQIRRLAAG